MQGLELAEEFFEQFGRPLIEKDFSEYSNRIAAGLVGAGSECLGFDDAISRDHDWGPAFCLWLTDDDFKLFGEKLHKAYTLLPQVHNGFGPRTASPGEEWRVGVTPIRTFYARVTGLGTPPASNDEWLAVPEHCFASAVNGKVFTDPLGEFSRWREAIASYYPEDVRLKKIASRCITIAQSGQYNFVRSSERQERFGAEFALTEFCNDVLSLTFLLNRTFTPFYKWRHRAVGLLPILGKDIQQKIDLLLHSQESKSRTQYIEEIVALLIETLHSQNLTTSSSDFLLEHAGEIHSKIGDEKLGARLTVVQ
ncbi:DUF4037 domain-containing protein [Desulforhopalus sp. 52FAK]